MGKKVFSENNVTVVEKSDASGTYWEVQLYGNYVTDHYDKDLAISEAKDIATDYA